MLSSKVSSGPPLDVMAQNSSQKVMKNEEIIDYLWMVRPCQIYYDEFKECSSMRGRFHQLYIHGETLDCWKWKQDYTNCINYEKTEDPQHLVQVLANEEERKAARQAGASGNDVWEYRTEPPEDWEKPIAPKLTGSLIPVLKPIEGNKKDSKKSDSADVPNAETVRSDGKPTCVVS